MKSITHILTLAGALCAAAVAHANTPLLVDPMDFTEDGNWIAGSNRFLPITNWVGFETLPVPERVAIAGDNITFSSWDDGSSDRIESFLFQEFGAGPAGSGTPNTLFEAGDVIVFTGEASGTRSGNGTDAMLVRAFIKTLGYNELGWEFQTKPEQTHFFNIVENTEAFELRVTFPDLSVDDSFQVLQVGFEVRTDFIEGAMQEGTITFSNLNAYIEGEGGTEPDVTWAGIVVDAEGNVDTGDFLGLVHATNAPWVYLFSMSRWAYIPDPGADSAGAWSFMLNTGN